MTRRYLRITITEVGEDGCENQIEVWEVEGEPDFKLRLTDDTGFEDVLELGEHLFEEDDR